MNEEHQKNLSDWIILESKNQDYDCPEAMLAACNEYYQLGLDQNVIDMMAGFGEGMFVHKTCGALVGAAAALSALIHRSAQKGKPVDLEKAMQTLIGNFKSLNGVNSLNCEDIKPHNWAGEERFVRTDLIAGQALIKTLEQMHVDTSC